MSLTQRIKDRKKGILRSWFQEVLDSFPKQSQALIANNSDRFANPIGFTLNDAIAEIYAGVVGEKTLEDIRPALERITKLRAIQDKQNPGQLGFLYGLKKILRTQCGAFERGFDDVEGLLEIEDRIDEIILLALEIYVQSREKIYELQVNELQNKTYMMRRLQGDA